VLVEQFFTVGPVEAFDVGILVWLPRLDILDRHAGVLCPTGEGFSEELPAIVCPQNLWQSMFCLQALKDPHQAHRGIDLDVQRLTIEVVNDIECSEATADETVVFSWIEWPDKETRDAAMSKMMSDDFNDERMDPDKNPAPFDGKRLIYGGFMPIVEL
jgi:hypothetical protein